MAIKADGVIRIDTKIDSKNFNQGVNNISSSVGGLTKSVGKLGIALGLAFSVKALVQFGKSAIKVASDLEEVQNVVDVAFGGMTEKIEALSKKAIELYGVSELTYKRMASTFMAMGKGMGMTHEISEKMALSLSGLSADVASFYNVRVDVAETALKSVYTGETETLKKYGIAMTEVNLEQFALAKGINKSIEAMTQTEKVQLRYLYVTEQLSLAQGDFVRTQESWANQTKILEERFNQLKATVGKLLTNVLAPFVKMLNSVVQTMILVAEQFNEFTGLNKKLKEIEEANKKTAKSEEKLADGIDKATASAKRALLPFDTLTILKNELSEDDIDFGIASFEEPQIIGENMVVGDNAKKVAGFFTFLKEEFNGFIIAINHLVDSTKNFISEIYNNGILPFIPQIKEAVLSMVNLLSNALTSITDVIATIIDLLTPIAVWLTENLLPPIMGVISSIIDAMNGIIDFIYGTFTGDWERAWNGVKDIFINLWEIIDTVLRAIENLFQPVMENIYKVLDDSWNAIKNFLINIWNDISEGFENIWDSLISFFVESFETIKITAIDIAGGLRNAWNGLWDGMSKKFKTVWENMVEFMRTPINTMIGFVNGMITAVVDGVNAVFGALNKISVDIPEWKILPSDIRGQKFGFNIGKINAPQIPYLAKGAVIPPNSEFMAVLGDQKMGTNIETPEALLREIIAQGNAETANYLGEKLDRLISEVSKGQNIVIDGRKMSRALDKYMQELNLVKGRNLNHV